MKKTVVLSVATLMLVAFLLALPALMGSAVTTVTIVRPAVREISDDIYVSGALEERSKKEVTLELPLVPGQVDVSVGDPVEAGQVLASVDAEATREAIFQMLSAAELIPTEYVEAMGSITQIEGLESLSSLSLDALLLDSLIPDKITAPASGVVTSLSLSSGAIALPKSAVCTISQTDSLRVKLSVEETEADRVKVGDTVVFKASATGSAKYTGVVTGIFPAASKALVGTSQQTVVGVYASVEGNAERLKPGYSVNGVIKKTTGETALTIPYEAVCQDDQNQEYVYLYDKGKAVRRDITTGTEYSAGVAVINGLDQEDYVIADASLVRGENSLVTCRS